MTAYSSLVSCVICSLFNVLLKIMNLAREENACSAMHFIIENAIVAHEVRTLLAGH